MSTLLHGDNTLKAIIWDYDGTLFDTRQKNYQVILDVVRVVTGKSQENNPVLRSFDDYLASTYRMMNWRELYTLEIGLSEEETDLAGSLWTEYQLKDNTPVKVFDGLKVVLESLDNFPQGIVSMNGQKNIAEVLGENNLSPFFDVIIGYEQVPFGKQKPDPEPLRLCLEQLINNDPGLILYIGDHKTDFECAKNANYEFEKSRQQSRVLSVGALYGYLTENTKLGTKPDFWAHQPVDILAIVAQISSTSGY